MTRGEAPTPGGIRVGVAVPAAGVGRRMGGARKPFLELAGEPVLVHALRALLADERVVRLVVALAPDDARDPPPWVTATDPRVRIVAGGDTRGESVRNALDALGDVDVIAVHDAARPLVSVDVVRRCIDVAASGEGAVVGTPAVDTMKRVGADGTVEGTADRTRLWHAHTPQVFPADVLRRAYEGDLTDATDESSLAERLGVPIRMVDGGRANLKVTVPEDLPVAEALLAALRARS